MKIIGITGVTILSFLLVVAPAFAQQERQGEKQDNPERNQAKQEPKPEKPKAQPQHQEEQKQPQHARQQTNNEQSQTHQQESPDQNNQPAHQQKPSGQTKQPQHAQQHKASGQNRQPQQAQQQRDNQQSQRTQEQTHVQQAAWQQHRTQSWDSDHRSWQQRGGYNGYRIPDDRFRGYFGQEHNFRIYGLPFLVVGGYPRFQYEGYWFSMVDPWPGYWASDWYDTDDVYVAFVDNGYYLFDRRYPNVGMAISISM